MNRTQSILPYVLIALMSLLPDILVAGTETSPPSHSEVSRPAHRRAAHKAARERAARTAKSRSERSRRVRATHSQKEQSVPQHALGINLLRWATFSPEVTWMWHVDPMWELSLSGSMTSNSWQLLNRRYAFWKIEPEVRRYLGPSRKWYASGAFSFGEGHYKFTDNGREGWIWGAGLGLGYMWRLSDRTSIDFHIGAGYNGGDLQRYDLVTYYEGQSPQRTYRDTKYYQQWGVNQLGFSLIWELGQQKGGRP